MAAKVALITASSAGLGAACVKALASHFRVVVNYYSRPEKAAEVIKDASTVTPNFQSSSENEPRFHSIQADVSDRTQIKKLIDETVSKMGGWTSSSVIMAGRA